MGSNHKNVYKIMALRFFKYPLWLIIEWQSMNLLISTKVNTKWKCWFILEEDLKIYGLTSWITSLASSFQTSL